jgi:hypothetical protein
MISISLRRTDFRLRWESALEFGKVASVIQSHGGELSDDLFSKLTKLTHLEAESNVFLRIHAILRWNA